MSAIVAPTAKIDQALNESKKRKATEGTSAGQLEKKIKKLNTKSSSSPQSEVKDEETNRRESLPIFQYREQILNSVRNHATTIVVGETGSGKSTQIPQFLASDKSIARGKCVICTQPRRVAAITIAEQVAKERHSRLGDEVGYSIRFEDKTSFRTRIKYATDGVLLREIMSDPLLTQYSVVLLDEAHERSMQTDILMGLLKEVQKVRKDLKIIVMSATLQVELFQGFFQDVGVVNVPGRQYPVSILYTREPEADFVDAALITCLQIHEEEEQGGVLIFLPGQEDIENLQQLLKEHLPSIRSKHGGIGRSTTTTTTVSKATNADNSNENNESNSNGPKEVSADNLQDFVILPLYAALSPEDQLKAFAIPPPGVRKFVLATNIAETSVTISGIRYVVDTGFVKTRAIAGVTGVESLQSVPVAQSQALQRAGRAGRESAGVCYRLYPESVYESLAQTSKPEIQRMNLAQVVLQLISMLSGSSSNGNHSGSNNRGGFLHIRSIRDFPFLSPPSMTGMKQALITLLRLQALDRNQQLTPLGRQMSLLPLSPPYARMLLAAPALSCTAETLTAVALLSTENLFIQPSHEQEKQQALKRHRTFCLPEGDLPTLIHIYHTWIQAHRSKHWAERNFLSQRALLHAQSVREQLSKLLQTQAQVDVTSSQWPDNKNAFLRCLLMGLSANIAVKSIVMDQQNSNNNIANNSSNNNQSVTHSGKIVSYSSPQKNQRHHQHQGFAQNSNMTPYRTLEGHQGVHLHPSSSLFATVQKGLVHQMPAYLVYAELLVTTKQYMRNVTIVSEELVASVLTEQQSEQQTLNNNQI